MFKTVHYKLNAVLLPAQPAVTILLIGTAAACIYMAFAVKDPTARTAFATWIIAP